LTPIRPKFANPPLVERAVTVVFEKSALSLGDYGLFWSSIQQEFPISECAGPIPSEIEHYEGFKPAQTKFELMDAGVLPRALFRNPAKGELIQLQPDRFSFNWLKAGDDDTYPHSEAVLERFFVLLRRFIDFSQDRGLGDFLPLQCEITNVNVIPVSDIGNSFVDFATIVKLPDLTGSEQLLQLESQIAGAKHLILGDGGEPVGRVHSTGQPTLRASTEELVYRLDITARGAPIGSGLKGVERFFDKAVSAVNGVFLASVTQSGRKFWGEIHG
jgi:uncharacterized protein (TIGR04255 family)